MRVLIADSIAEIGIDILRKESEVDVKTGLKEEELVEIIGAYHALVVRSATQVTAPVIAAGRNLKIIGRAGTGIDNIDVEEATKRGIIVVNVPDGNTISAAEHTLGLMMALARNIPEASATLKAGKWEKKKFMGVEISGKTIGVIGLGRIGFEVAKRCRAFNTEVVAFDPYISRERAERAGINLVPLDDLLRTADFITVHTPLTKETAHLLSDEAFEKMKPGVRLVNAARGGIVDEQALYRALTSGKVAGAALDVFEQEPTTASPLFELKNVIVTPHLGASTYEAQDHNAVAIADQILKVFRGEPVPNAVNLPSLPKEEWEQVAPFLPMAEMLASFFVQAFPGRLSALEVFYGGQVAEFPVVLLTNAVLKGILSRIVSEPVNLVNAPIIAEQRGLRTTQTKTTERREHTNIISLRASVNGRQTSLSGTVTMRGEARLVAIDGYSVDLAPTEHILLARHTDKPGMIGRVGTLLGNHGINIAGMQVGRRAPRGEAVMILLVDEEIPDALLEELKQLDGIGKAYKIHLPAHLLHKAE